MKDLKIKFVSHADENLASHRMRVEKPVELLKKRGYNVSWSQEAEADDDVVVFQKHINPSYIFQTTTVLQNFGKKVIFDISDDHFANPPLADYYKAMTRKADLVTACGKGVQDRIRMFCEKEAMVIRDPLTFPRYKPKVMRDVPSILWFGHASNVKSLGKYIHDLPNLTIVSNTQVNTLNPFVRSIPWQPGLVEKIIKDFDIVILPVSEDKIWKNENRAADAIQAGTFVVTDTLRPHLPLRNFMFVGDILEGIGWASNNKELVQKIILDGQEFLDNNYNDDLLADQWEEAIKQVTKDGQTES